MLGDAHLKLIYVNYVRHTQKKLQRGVLMKNTTDIAPSISNFLG